MKIDIRNLSSWGHDIHNGRPYIRFTDFTGCYVSEEQFEKINEGINEYNKRCEPFRSKIRRLYNKINKPYYVELTKEKEND